MRKRQLKTWIFSWVLLLVVLVTVFHLKSCAHYKLLSKLCNMDLNFSSEPEPAEMPAGPKVFHARPSFEKGINHWFERGHGASGAARVAKPVAD
jgi:hypothetical protein